MQKIHLGAVTCNKCGDVLQSLICVQSLHLGCSPVTSMRKESGWLGMLYTGYMRVCCLFLLVFFMHHPKTSSKRAFSTDFCVWVEPVNGAHLFVSPHSLSGDFFVLELVSKWVFLSLSALIWMLTLGSRLPHPLRCHAWFCLLSLPKSNIGDF